MRLSRRRHGVSLRRSIPQQLRSFAPLLLLMAALAPPPAPAEPAAPSETPGAAPATEAPAAVERAPRRARNVDLDAPFTDSLLNEYDQEVKRSVEAVSEQAQERAMAGMGEVDTTSLLAARNAPFVLLGSEVPAGTATRLAWQPGESFAGIAVPTPVLVVHGIDSGPVLCLTAAVHGDELNGIEMVRRVLYDIPPAELRGTVVGVPIVNLLGFKRSSRYLPDRRDLNRHFPGNPDGSSASRIAYSFFNEIVRHCTVLVDLHTGSFYRTNLPQLRADLRRPDVVALTESFTSSTAVVHSPGASGSLRRAAAEFGIPAITLEAGEPLRLQSAEVDKGVTGVFALIDHLGMYRKLRVWGNPEPVHYQSRWVRADSGGILFGKVNLGQRVSRGTLLGTVTDPITNVRADIISPYEGRVIGMAVDQVVLPGFAAFHIGIQTSADDLYEPTAPGSAPPPTPAEPEPDGNGSAPDRLEDS